MNSGLTQRTAVTQELMATEDIKALVTASGTEMLTSYPREIFSV